MPRKIFWTQDDLDLMREARQTHRMSWNDIARILGIHTQTAVTLGKKLGIHRLGEVVEGRNPLPWSRPPRENR